MKKKDFDTRFTLRTKKNLFKLVIDRAEKELTSCNTVINKMLEEKFTENEK